MSGSPRGVHTTTEYRWADKCLGQRQTMQLNNTHTREYLNRINYMTHSQRLASSIKGTRTSDRLYVFRIDGNDLQRMLINAENPVGIAALGAGLLSVVTWFMNTYTHHGDNAQAVSSRQCQREQKGV
jgi:hypothetical protein